MGQSVANDLLASMVLAVWLYLLAGRGGFWLGRQRDDEVRGDQGLWPAVAAVIPARDEAESVGQTISSLLRQDYPGEFTVILVDDQSRDATAEVARAAAAALGVADGLTVLPGRPPPAGWTGKLWAQHQGIELAEMAPHPPVYLLLTDADIVYAPDALTRLVVRAQSGGYALTSLMAKLRCESFAERAFVPAFIFFFQMLYPFAWVNRSAPLDRGRRRRLHAGARRGLAPGGRHRGDPRRPDRRLRAGEELKAHGPIWLGLTERVRSIRAYPVVADIRRMVARSAYAQLGYSPLLLAGTVARPDDHLYCADALALFATGVAQVLGILAWLAMAVAFQPTLRFYRLSPLWGLALPAIAAIYMAFTIDSAYQHARGRGGMWKGRVQANVSELR